MQCVGLKETPNYKGKWTSRFCMFSLTKLKMNKNWDNIIKSSACQPLENLTSSRSTKASINILKQIFIKINKIDPWGSILYTLRCLIKVIKMLKKCVKLNIVILCLEHGFWCLEQQFVCFEPPNLCLLFYEIYTW